MALPGGLGWWFLDAQPSTSVHGALHGIPWHRAGTQVWQGTGLPPPPSQATAHRTPPRSLRSCFPFKSTQGHPVLWVNSCGGGPHSGQNGAFSQLPTLNMGGQGLSGKCFLAIWRWHLLSVLGALLLEMLFFCFLCLQNCVCSMVLRNLTWEKTFWICCSGIEGPV